MRYRPFLLLLIILSVLATACGGSATAEPSAAADQPPASTGAITTADSELGTILVNADGLTLYGFTDDTEGVSTCYDACAETWPPVPGDAAPDASLDAALFTTAARDDGGDQVVAGEWPLYTFAGDAAPGDVNGQGSGDVWFVVAPDGTLIDGTDDPADAGAPASEAAASEAPADAADGVDQPVLTDADGLTLYYFRNDGAGASNCNAPCSDTWPPVAADEQIDTSGLELGRLGSITRDDGSEQLAYDGRPLYRYIDDAAPGDVNGQGVGNVWFAAAADGSEIAPQGVRIGSTDAGDVLIDGEGFTLYTFANDAPGASSCNDPCVQTWPPVPGDAAIDGSAVGAGQFDTVTRDDGSQQLALDGQPLYRYIDDANPGDANGQGIGDVWFAVPADDVKGPGTGAGGGAAARDAGASTDDGAQAGDDASGAGGSDYR
ncbi:MAG TPA: hypothetical protein VK891_00350 [Euzebyales bacterium]|nr:hypothetical protein [Euzebyales bacterium]